MRPERPTERVLPYKAVSQSRSLEKKSSFDQVEAAVRRRSFLASIAGIGPGILVMLADTDAGNVVTAAQSGAQWGYRLLPLLLGLIPVLYMVQELAVRLGVFTGRGYSELVRYHYGSGWAWVLAAGLVLAVAGSMTTEFAAVAGIGELYGVSRNLTLPIGDRDPSGHRPQRVLSPC